MKKIFFFTFAILCTVAQGAWAQTPVSTDQELRSAITNGANITVAADIDLSNRTLEIASGTTVTIDLGGHTLDRKLTQRGEYGGQVFTVRKGATLNLSNGTITGAWGGGGGGMVIESESGSVGTANLTDVIITKNVAVDRGGGICNYGTLTMTGGAITDNISQDNATPRGGGGLFNKEGATATLTGVTISGNRNVWSGGGGICNHGTLTLDGCTITGNQTWSTGGAVWNDGTLNVKGANTIQGNKSDDILSGINDDLYLDANTITVTGSLAGSTIYVNMKTPGVFTSGYSTDNSGVDPATIFHPEMPGVMAVTLDGGEAKLGNCLPAGGVYYIEHGWDDVNKTVTSTVRTLESSEFTVLSGNKTGNLHLSAGNYVVQGNCHVSDVIFVEGNTNLILCDGAKLAVSKGVLVSPPDGQNCTLNIFGQVNNSGQLVNEQEIVSSLGLGGSGSVDDTDVYPGIGTFSGMSSTINFHGGTINVVAHNGYAAAIGNGLSSHDMGTINFYGGDITATGGCIDGRNLTFGSAAIGTYNVRANGSINIYGGNITAISYFYGPGIGTGNYGNEGNDKEFNVTINGGRVLAKGGNKAAGIGCGTFLIGNESFMNDHGIVQPTVETYMSGKTITINGGSVEAHGDSSGAGIGGGYCGNGGNVTINGGRVEAHGGDNGAGIGSGEGNEYPVDGGSLIINDGEVYAYGGENGAGIGGGGICHGADVTVNGGKVYAYGGEDAAGIGSGYEYDRKYFPCNGGKLTVTGGEVYAYGNEDGAGIGGGSNNSGANVTITGGIVVAHAGEDDTGYRAIGPGYDNDNYGQLTIGDEMMVKSERLATAAERKNMCWYRTRVRVEPCTHSSVTYTVSGTTADDTHTAHCRYCTTAFTPEKHNFVDGTCTVCGVSGTAFSVSIYLPVIGGNDGVYADAIVYQITKDATFDLPAAPVENTPANLEFAGWLVANPTGLSTFVTNGSETLLSVGKSYTISSNVSFTARYQQISIILADDAHNGEVLSQNNGKTVASVTLSGRTLYKDGKWNTLCLPFDATLTGDLADATLMELDTEKGEYAHITGFENGTLYLNFKSATSIEAGTPYIIKWGTPESHPSSNLTNPTFSNVTISDTRTEVESADGTLVFAGAYSPLSIGKENKSLLFLGGNNTLYYPQPADAEHPITIGSCRAHFRLKGIEAGDPVDPSSLVRAFVLNFDDNANGIIAIENGKLTIDNSWFTLSGRKLSGKPSRAGVYIYNGKKVMK